VARAIQPHLLSASQEAHPGLALTYGLSPIFGKKSKPKLPAQSSLTNGVGQKAVKDSRISDTDLTRLERKVERLK